MNPKAEAFRKYLDVKGLRAFQSEEIPDDEFQTVVFRSFADIHGARLPVAVILDTSIYGIIRFLVAPKAVQEETQEELLAFINGYNKKYKSFKYYLDDEGNLVLDTCLLYKDDAVDGDMIYTMFDVILHHLNESYPKLMKIIWD